ncbi:DUF447 domain-containing protein [Xanthobacter sp. TB0139]|uniref:DUF447 domain-containing protein n=1 Tax=Xanthobacter sp. TB0139 TaxID=3459178 RepID=UPI004039F127
MTAEAIHEVIITTLGPDGAPHVAPMGVRFRGGDEEHVFLWPFAPSSTLDNIRASGHAVLNAVTDSRIFAGCVTGRQRIWPVVPAEKLPGVRLAAALHHMELNLIEDDGDTQRPLLTLRRIHEGRHGRFTGLNRAQAAVIEAAVLASRLHLLPPEKITQEMAYLQIAIDRTAGDSEREAWGWINDKIAAFKQEERST